MLSCLQKWKSTSCFDLTFTRLPTEVVRDMPEYSVISNLKIYSVYSHRSRVDLVIALPISHLANSGLESGTVSISLVESLMGLFLGIWKQHYCLGSLDFLVPVPQEAPLLRTGFRRRRAESADTIGSSFVQWYFIKWGTLSNTRSFVRTWKLKQRYGNLFDI